MIRILPRLPRLLILPLMALSAAQLAPPAAAEDAAAGGIHVTGTGEIQVVPDMARVTLEVRREGQDAAALKTELDQVVRAVLELADELTIPRRKVTAAAVNVFPRYPRPEEKDAEPKVVATRTIEVEVGDLDLLGSLIDGALARGVNGIAGVALDISNRVEVDERALDRAIDDAVREARQVAERFEVRLGRLQSASTREHPVQPLMMERAAVQSSAAADSFSPGLITVRRTVDAAFAIH